MGCFPGSATLGGAWVRTSYNGNVRHNFAGVGMTFDPDADAFYAPQPYPSWSLDAAYQWQPPVPRPETTDVMIAAGEFWSWDEASVSWTLAGGAAT